MYILILVLVILLCDSNHNDGHPYSFLMYGKYN